MLLELYLYMWRGTKKPTWQPFTKYWGKRRKTYFLTVRTGSRDSPPLSTLSTENDSVPSPPLKLQVSLSNHKMVSSRGRTKRGLDLQEIFCLFEAVLLSNFNFAKN